jgi:hypothetical protein
VRALRASHHSVCICGTERAKAKAVIRHSCAAAAVLGALALPLGVHGTARDAAERPIEQFLSREDSQPSYRAKRRLEAINGERRGWLEAWTEYSRGNGFRFEVISEGGSENIRSKVLRAVLEGERDAIAHGETARSALVAANYIFEPNGVEPDGLAAVLLSPRRKERGLIAGRMLLHRADGALARVEGKLAKSPSFWVKSAHVVRTYGRIVDTVVPVRVDCTAQLRLFGSATLQMTYDYSEVEGRPIAQSARATTRRDRDAR